MCLVYTLGIRVCIMYLSPLSLLPFSQAQATVIKEVMAVADYTAQYEDELTFRAGDKIKITLESESDARSQPPPPPRPVLMRTPRIIVTMMQ